MFDDNYDDDYVDQDNDYVEQDLCEQFERTGEVGNDGDMMSNLGVEGFALALGLAETIADESAPKYFEGAEFLADDDEETHRKAEMISLKAGDTSIPEFERHVMSKLKN